MGGYGIAYVLIGGSHKCRHIADRGGRGSKKAQKLRAYLKNLPLDEPVLLLLNNRRDFWPSVGLV